MIYSPSTPQLVEVVRAELADRIAPSIDDPATRVALDMVLAILRSVSARSEHEIEWMKQETEQVLVIGRAFAEDLGRPATLTAAITALEDSAPSGLSLAEVCAEYALASEVLSVCAELAHSRGTALHRERIRRHFGVRLEHEDAITGGFQAVGRS